ncbi:MAG: bacterial Ig-like domain-containing protein [Anaeroplasmataceae bacterium]|nr:bacterial Ig-like domain-containing protein [Anaeroplasmataceae bacterium]
MKKVLICLSLIFLAVLAGCKKKDIDKPNPDNENKDPIIESIRVVDRSGKELKEDSVFAGLERTYDHSNIYVWTIYSNDTHKDVTKDATFSEVDLKEAKDEKITVSYDRFETSYTLHILENSVTSITVDYTNCKLLYPVGSVFNSAGLVVRGTFADGTTDSITDYKLSVGNSIADITTPFQTVGKKQIVVTCGKLTKEFDILVYQDNYTSSYDYKMDFLADEVILDEKGAYEFVTPFEAMNNAIATMHINHTHLETKEANGSDINHTYATETYHSFLAIPTEDGMEITLPYATDIFLLAGDLYGAKIYFKQGNQTYEAFGHNGNYTSQLYCSLEAGTYQLVSSKANVRLYNITFHSSRATASDIELDTKDMKKIYSIGQGLDLNGLKVYYVWEDGTKSIASTSSVSYRILNSNNNTVSSLDAEGTYTVIISLGNLSKRFNIEVTDNRRFRGIELDTTNVTKEFSGTEFQYNNLKVYGVAATGRELLTEGRDYEVTLSYDNQVVTGFTTPGTYIVTVTYIGTGCENNKGFYTVKYTKEVSRMSLDISAVKTEYYVGDSVDLSNLKVLLEYNDSNRDQLSLSSIKREIRKNGQSFTELSEVGTYEIIIKYQNFEEKFTITVSPQRVYERIELDTSEVTKSFTGTGFNSNKLKAYAIDTGGNRKEVSNGDLKVVLTLAGNEVSSFSSSGTYTVYVFYVGSIECTNDTASYDVTYTARRVQFGYSGPSVPLESWYEDIIYPINYSDYIKVPDDTYVFLGFGGDIEGQSFIKIYVEKKKTGSACTYTYVTPRYEYITSSTSASSPTIPSYLLKNNEIFDHYELDTQKSTANYKLYIAVCREEVVSPNVTIHSLTTASIDIPSTYTGTITVNGILTDSDGVEIPFTNLTQEFHSLDSNKQYTISGSIEANGSTAKILPTTFSTHVAGTLTSITEDQALRHISATSIEIDCAPYIHSLPNGYQLVGFQLIKETGEVVREEAYTLGMETVYFTGLEENTKYSISSCYKEIEPVVFSIPTQEETKFTYDFCFVGFWIISYGDELYRVRMQYQGDTLYTWYVGNFNYFDNMRFCQFAMPNELSDYTVIGCETPLYNITEDIDVEVILVKKNPNQEIVAFYGFQQVLLDYQVVASGATVSYPAPPATVEWGKYTYTFDSWAGPYSIYYNGEVKVYNAIYKCTNETETSNLVYPLKFYIFTDKLYRERIVYSYSQYYVDYSERIYLATGEDVTSTLTFTPANGADSFSYGDYSGLLPDTEYIYKGVLIYDLLDGNGNQTKEYTYSFKTMALNATKNVTITCKKSPRYAYSLQVAANKNNFDSYIFFYDHYVRELYNDEHIEWKGYTLGYLKDTEPVYIYYADRETLDDDTVMTYVYPSKSLSYQLDEIREVEIEDISVEYVMGEHGISHSYITVKGKNVAYADLNIMCPADYQEFGGGLPNAIAIANYEKTVSDDEVVYVWYAAWELGAEHQYDCFSMRVSDIHYIVAGESHSGFCQIADVETVDNKTIAHFTIDMWY